MIVIVSNGKTYSDHRLYFVEAPSVEAVASAMKTLGDELMAREDWNPIERAKVIGTAESLAWNGETASSGAGTTMTLAEFVQNARDWYL